MYEEVEAHTGMRPVLVFGALADQVVASLMESYPNLFYCCKTGEWGSESFMLEIWFSCRREDW